MSDDVSPRPLRCSEYRDEPLPGTAPTDELWLCLEHTHGWSRDVLDGGTFSAELTAGLSEISAHFGARIICIRRPGRAGQWRTGRRVYAAWSRQGILESWQVHDLSEVLDADLSAPGRVPQATVVGEPIALVCTHGKRDRCCAIAGRPITAALDTWFPNERVWESSHTSGHRFAPAVVLLPHGLAYGRISARPAVAALGALDQGTVSLEGYRGRSIHGAYQQVADHAIRSFLVQAGEVVGLDALVIGDPAEQEDGTQCVEVAHEDGRRWGVTIDNETLEPRPASCGATPKKVAARRVINLTQC